MTTMYSRLIQSSGEVVHSLFELRYGMDFLHGCQHQVDP